MEALFRERQPFMCTTIVLLYISLSGSYIMASDIFTAHIIVLRFTFRERFGFPWQQLSWAYMASPYKAMLIIMLATATVDGTTETLNFP